MTGAHDEKIIERALDIAVFLLASLEIPLEENGPPVTQEELKEFLFSKAHQELGYTKDDLGRWVKI